MVERSFSRSDYGTISGQARGFTAKESEGHVDSLRSVEDALHRIRKNTESLRSIGLRVGTSSVHNKPELCDDINTIIRNTLKVVEQCLSNLRVLRQQSSDLVGFRDTQHKVSMAVSDFQTLSREIMLSLQHSGPGSRRSRRRKQRYKSFNDSESDAALSDTQTKSLSYYKRRKSSPELEQEVFIITLPTGRDNLTDFENIESDIQALEEIMNEIRTLSTEQDKAVHSSVSPVVDERPQSTDRQIQFPYPCPTTNSSTEHLPKSLQSGKKSMNSKKFCSCCCIS